MIPLPKDILPQDINQWLGDGWFLFQRNDGEFVPARLINAKTSNNFTIIQDYDGMDHSLKNVSSLFAHWPLCGSINIHSLRAAYYLKRLQKKQFKRTFNSACLYCSLPRDASYTKKGTPRLDLFNGSTIYNVFNPSYYCFSQAKNMIQKEGWYSVAISPSVIVAGATEPHTVFFHGTPAGKINKKNIYTPTLTVLTEKIIRQFKGEVSL